MREYTNRTKKFYDLVQIKVKLKNGDEEDRWLAYCNDIDGLQKYVRKERGIDENSESLCSYRFMAIALWLSLYGYRFIAIALWLSLYCYHMISFTNIMV